MTDHPTGTVGAFVDNTTGLGFTSFWASTAPMGFRRLESALRQLNCVTLNVSNPRIPIRPLVVRWQRCIAADYASLKLRRAACEPGDDYAGGATAGSTTYYGIPPSPNAPQQKKRKEKCGVRNTPGRITSARGKASLSHSHLAIMPQFHAADVQAPTFPGPILPDNNPPSAQAIRALAHPSAVWNLYRVVHDNVHFEHTTYGYFNAVLNTVLPTHRGYQVIHLLSVLYLPLNHGRLRSNILCLGVLGTNMEGLRAPSGGNIVAELVRYLLLTRHSSDKPCPTHVLSLFPVTGREANIQYPDFMVTKTFPMPLGSPRRKHILTIIKIKVDSKDVEAVSEDPPRSTLAGAHTQLERYIDRIMRTQGISCEVPFEAYLVYGRFYQRVTVNTVQPFGGNWDQPEWIFVQPSAGHTPFLDILSQISATHWNMIS
ncbi:hypothetical protein B0H13DRAFT_1919000 [Mycena leptocephala]|nr:hypothetical protein B0H13DRAFT_1919000 [Mycena leptocephala]